jgi:tetratricopeptide (TPR) repeat protein
VFPHLHNFRKRHFLSLLFVIGLVISLAFGQISSPLLQSAAIAQVQSADQWMQQGADRYQVGNFSAAIDDWETALELYQIDNDLEKVAIALENMARAHQALGQTSEELQHWEQARFAYQQAGNRLRVGRMLTEQAQAYSRLGQYTKAIDLLCGNSEQQVCLPDSALQIAQSLSDRVGEVVALGSLGDAYRLRGKADRAVFYLEQGLAIARALQEPTYLISTLNSLGNAQASQAQLNYRRAASSEQIEEVSEASQFEAVARERDAEALRRLEESFSIAQIQSDRSGQLRALVSALPIYSPMALK